MGEHLNMRYHHAATARDRRARALHWANEARRLLRQLGNASIPGLALEKSGPSSRARAFALLDEVEQAVAALPQQQVQEGPDPPYDPDHQDPGEFLPSPQVIAQDDRREDDVAKDRYEDHDQRHNHVADDVLVVDRLWPVQLIHLVHLIHCRPFLPVCIGIQVDARGRSPIIHYGGPSGRVAREEGNVSRELASISAALWRGRLHPRAGDGALLPAKVARLPHGDPGARAGVEGATSLPPLAHSLHRDAARPERRRLGDEPLRELYAGRDRPARPLRARLAAGQWAPPRAVGRRVLVPARGDA